MTDAPDVGVMSSRMALRRERRARFTKGQPRSVTLLEPLLAELEHEASGGRPGPEGYVAAWERLREAAIAPRLDHARLSTPR